MAVPYDIGCTRAALRVRFEVGDDGDGGVVEVPRDHAEIRRRDPALAARWREATAEALEACFRAGSIAASFDKTLSAYALVPGASE